MFCKNCGSVVNDDAKFCANCGCAVDENSANGAIVSPKPKKDLFRQ